MNLKTHKLFGGKCLSVCLAPEGLDKPLKMFSLVICIFPDRRAKTQNAKRSVLKRKPKLTSTRSPKRYMFSRGIVAHTGSKLSSKRTFWKRSYIFF